MRKIQRLAICFILMTVFVFAAACGGSNVPPPDDEGTDGEKVLDKATIVDIYDPNRPNYEFDRESSYVKPDPPEIPDPDRKYTLSLSSESDISFEGGASSVELKAGDPLPTVLNTTGKDIGGWYNVSEKHFIWKHTQYTLRNRNSDSNSGAGDVTVFEMPAKNISIAPFFVESGQRPLIPASQAIDTNSTLAARNGTKFFETDTGVQIGAEITYKGGIYSGTPVSPLSGGGYFRMLTSCASSDKSAGAIGLGSHTFHYWFKNLGTETMKFRVYQGSSGLNIYAGANTVEITLAEGETWSGAVTIDIASANANALTFLIFATDHTVNNANFAMVMSKSPLNDVA